MPVLRRRAASPLVALVAFALALALNISASAQDTPADPAPSKFRAGLATIDITPPAPTPMWGYGARHDLLSTGTIDPLLARALVLEASGRRAAFVSLDLGRGPTRAMMTEIRRDLESDRIEFVLLCGSHSHHTPVIELTDRPGRGRGKFDPAVAYAASLPQKLADVIRQAATRLEPVRWGYARVDTPLNRNRHWKTEPKPLDPTLSVVRFDRPDGAPLAVWVNFAAHPVMTPGEDLRFSADYVASLRTTVESELGAPCLFFQGASGDQSPNSPPGVSGPAAFGATLGRRAVELARTIETKVPRDPSLEGSVDTFEFRSRTDFTNTGVQFLYSQAFFPELVKNFVDDFQAGIRPELTVLVINRELSVVGGSGEFFNQHAVRLRTRAPEYFPLFFGYCNGHDMYFPTIEAVARGGYGADPAVSPVEVGAGERIMDRALQRIYQHAGKLGPD